MRKYYAKQLTKKARQREVFKIQMAVIITCTALSLCVVQARAYVPDRPVTGVNAPEIKKDKETESENKSVNKSENKSVKEQILEIAEEENFKWPDYLVRLSYCESRWDPKATNNNGKYGVDRGVFQINDYYHPEIPDNCAFNVECSTKWTIRRINNNFQHEWACDKIVKGNYDYLE